MEEGGGTLSVTADCKGPYSVSWGIEGWALQGCFYLAR